LWIQCRITSLIRGTGKDGEKKEEASSSSASAGASASATQGATQEPISSSSTSLPGAAVSSSGSEKEGANKPDKDLLSTDPAYAGHVILHYPSGGKLLCAMTHWVELQKLDVNEERLLQVRE
jgi:hypothetical protein